MNGKDKKFPRLGHSEQKLLYEIENFNLDIPKGLDWDYTVVSTKLWSAVFVSHEAVCLLFI